MSVTVGIEDPIAISGSKNQEHGRSARHAYTDANSYCQRRSKPGCGTQCGYRHITEQITTCYKLHELRYNSRKRRKQYRMGRRLPAQFLPRALGMSEWVVHVNVLVAVFACGGALSKLTVWF